MKLQNLYLDLNKSGLNSFLLTGKKPWFNYQNGKRTNEQLGTTYEVALPNHQLDKINVHVKDDNGTVEPNMQQVKFKNLEAEPYPNYSNPSEVGIRATADAIYEVKRNG